MSNPTTLLSKLVPFAISTDGSNYSNIVCKKAWDMSLDIPLVQEDTDCGKITGVGTPGFTFNVEFIFNTTPGSGEVSANEVAGYANSSTLVYVKVSDGAGYIRSGSGYLTNYKESAPVNGFITATATLTGSGTISLS